jgi:hypothetical protein
MESKIEDGTPGQVHTLLGNSSGRAALKSEQREQLENNHREKWASGKEGEADHRRHKHRSRKAKWLYAVRREQCGM